MLSIALSGGGPPWPVMRASVHMVPQVGTSQMVDSVARQTHARTVLFVRWCQPRGRVGHLSNGVRVLSVG